MLKKWLTVLGLAAVSVWGVSAQDAKTVVANASKAIGVDALKSVQYSATGIRLRARPGAESNVAVAPVHREELHAVDRFRERRRRASIASGCRARIRRAAAASSRSSASSRRPRRSSSAPRRRGPQQLEIWMMPHGFLRAAAARNATVEIENDQRQEATRS